MWGKEIKTEEMRSKEVKKARKSEKDKERERKTKAKDVHVCFFIIYLFEWDHRDFSRRTSQHPSLSPFLFLSLLLMEYVEF